MAAPRGAYTAPRSSPIAGQTFASLPGDAPTAPYNRYLQARAQALGFSGYSQQRRAKRVALADSTYLWCLSKTLQRRFSIGDGRDTDYSEIMSQGKKQLRSKVGDEIKWSQEEGIARLTYEEAVLKLYTEALASDWDTRHDGPYARLLELIGIREERAVYDVGDTPTPT